MCSGGGDGQLRPPGFPIRKPPDHSLVTGSPGLIAGSNVLHRLLVPRHPPCALINLGNLQMMLASTIQISRYGRPRTSTTPHKAAQAQPVLRGPEHTLVPSGPNSVPTHTPSSPAVPPPLRKGITY